MGTFKHSVILLGTFCIISTTPHTFTLCCNRVTLKRSQSFTWGSITGSSKRFKKTETGFGRSRPSLGGSQRSPKKKSLRGKSLEHKGEVCDVFNLRRGTNICKLLLSVASEDVKWSDLEVKCWRIGSLTYSLSFCALSSNFTFAFPLPANGHS